MRAHISISLIVVLLLGLAPVTTVAMDAKQTRLNNLTTNLTTKAEAAQWRLEHIADRLSKRIAQTAPSPHVTVANETLGNATAELAAIAEQLTEADAVAQAFVSSERPADAWPQTQRFYQSLQTQLQRVLGNLRLTHAILSEPDNFTELLDTDPVTSTSTDTSTASTTTHTTASSTTLNE